VLTQHGRRVALLAYYGTARRALSARAEREQELNAAVSGDDGMDAFADRDASAAIAAALGPTGWVHQSPSSVMLPSFLPSTWTSPPGRARL
jgi:hypothetical protein